MSDISLEKKLSRRQAIDHMARVLGISGIGLAIAGLGGGGSNPPPTVPSAGDHKVFIDSSDTLADYLSPKLLVGSGITKTIENPSGNEDIKLAFDTTFGDARYASGSGASPFLAKWTAGGTIGSSLFQDDGTALKGTMDNTQDLGTQALRYRTGHMVNWEMPADGQIQIAGVARYQFESTVFFPKTDNLTSLAIPTVRFKSAYFGGALSVGFVTKTGTYSMGTDDYTVAADATSAAFTVTLPAANSVGGGGRKVLIIKKDSSVNAVTVSRAGSDTIEGATTKTLALQYDKINLISDGSSVWYDLGKGLI